MIRVRIVRLAERISEVTVSGHSGFARHGKDIVCAAVSAVSYTCLLGLMRFSNDSVAYEIEEKSGLMRFSVPLGKDTGETEKLSAIAETMLIGLKDIEKGYKAHIRIEEEVR